ncbi:MAG: tetratricopeptide repeat protein [Bacteroidetes bacterium]|nr:tetratricopeptide repeat protein [Bacteroidota bacterium]
MKKIWALLATASMALCVFAQPASTDKLATQYFENGEYEKALPLYKELAEDNPSSFYHYEHYLLCLIETKNFDQAEKFVRKRSKKYPSNPQFRVDEGYVMEKKGNGKDAENHYKKLIDDLGTQVDLYPPMASAFQKRKRTDMAIAALEAAELKTGGMADFSTQLAGLYMETGNREKGIEKYVALVLRAGYPYEQSKQLFEMNITDSTDFVFLRKLLLQSITRQPDSYELADLLKWTFIKQKDWQGAFVQTRSLDKRLKEKGQRVVELGELCMSNEAWDVATQCFEYVRTLGADGPFYDDAGAGLLETRYYQLKTQTTTDPVAMKTLETDCLTFLRDRGYSDYTYRVCNRLAELYTQYMHTPEKAVEMLENFVKSPGLSPRVLALGKLALGDAYTIDGDVWSSELLFAQVEKDFPEEALGQEAKFRRARLSYYRGDFDWAMLQLDVLKAATTQLISNNAIRLALTVTENLGLDSNYDALERFAMAELLITQNKLEEATATLDSIQQLYLTTPLADDILMQKAIISEKRQNWPDAEKYYKQLIAGYGTDILADNAWYRLAMLYLQRLNDPENAKKAFEKIILDYPGSHFLPEARKQYRKLRGDQV